MASEHLIWIREAPTDLISVRRSQRARRTHKKSRNGCGLCKVRRVKCDERMPICGQCEHRGTDCSYQHTATNGFYHTHQNRSASAVAYDSPYATTSDLSAEACLGLHVFATSISRVVDQRASEGLSSNGLAHLLQHFERSSYSTISSPIGQQILRDKIPQMLMSHPFLLHTVLAFSSSHIGYLSRDKGRRGNLFLTAGYYTQRALNLYAKRINLHQNDINHTMMKQHSSLEEMDALFASCIMLTSLFYHIDEMHLSHRSWTVPPPEKSLLVGHCDSGIDWLTNTSGLSILLQLTQFQQKLPDSIWLPFILEANRISARINGQTLPSTNSSGSAQSYTSLSASASTSSTRSSSATSKPNPTATSMSHDFGDLPLSLPSPSPSNLLNTPPHFLALVLSSHSTPYQPIYVAAVTALSPLLSLDPTHLSDFAAFISFPSRLSQEFIALLRRKRFTLPRLGCDDGLLSCSFTRPTMKSSTVVADGGIDGTGYADAYRFGMRMSVRADTGIHTGDDAVCGTGAATHTSTSTAAVPDFRRPMPDILFPESVAAESQQGRWMGQATSLSPTFLDAGKMPLPTPVPRSMSKPIPLARAPPSIPTSLPTNTSLPDLTPIPIPDPDPVALLIMGYWFDLVGRVPHWWCSRRGRGESVAILQWLQGRIQEARADSGSGSTVWGYSELRWGLFEQAVKEFEERIEKRERESQREDGI